MSTPSDPHATQPVRMGGPSLPNARLAVVLAHGRGGSADDMLNLGAHLAIPDVTFVAPMAAGQSWWPHSFLAPLEDNEPWLGSALMSFEKAVDAIMAQGFAPERIVVGGFSQGACLGLEHAARAGRPYKGIIGMSGGLVGSCNIGGLPMDTLYGYAAKGFDYTGHIEGSQVFLGCHEHDPHIPLARVRDTDRVFKTMGGAVKVKIHTGQGHGITEAEVEFLRSLLNE